jgi:hypothetical protein
MKKTKSILKFFTINLTKALLLFIFFCFCNTYAQIDEMTPQTAGGTVTYDATNGRFNSEIDGVNYYVEARHGWFFNTPYNGLTDAADHTGGYQLVSLAGANASTPDDVVFVFSAPVDLTSLGVFYTSHFSNSQYTVADLTPGTTNTPISISDSDLDNAGNGFDSSTVSFNWNNVTSFSFTRTGGTQAGSIADAFICVDRLNASAGSILGLDNWMEEVHDLKLFPNPTTDYIQISGLKNIENYSIYNVIGSEISKGTISNDEKVNIQNLTNGLYFLKFENGNTIKFIKE